MKKFYHLLILLFIFSALSFYSQAQSPESFQFQAIVTNEEAIVKEASVKIRISIRENSATGDKVYVETHNSITNVSGMVFLQVGKGTPTEGIFNAINWSQGTYFIEMEVDKGSGFIPAGTQQLLSVPYAKYSDNAGKVQLVSTNGKKWNVSIDDQGNISTQEITE